MTGLEGYRESAWRNNIRGRRVGYKYSVRSMTVVTGHNRHQGVRMATGSETGERRRAIGYLRVSTTRQAENGYGIEAQRQLPRAGANMEAWVGVHMPALGDF